MQKKREVGRNRGGNLNLNFRVNLKEATFLKRIKFF
jgi:hypothetical protein